MNYFLIQAIQIDDIDDAENGFFMQILVFLLVAISLVVYFHVKNIRSKRKEQQQSLPEEARTHNSKPIWRFLLLHKYFSPRKGIVQKYIAKMKGAQYSVSNPSQEPEFDFDRSDTAIHKKPEKKLAKGQNKNLHSGMELLELDFLLSIVENIKGNNQKDITIRKLNFNEVFRREKLNQVKSKVLTVYATDQSNLYGKDIQCQAMRELTNRTTHINRNEVRPPAVYPRRKKIVVDMNN
jgi:hypothetical protein